MSEAVQQETGFIYVPRYFIIVSLVVHVAFPLFYGGVVVLEKFGIKLFSDKKANTIEIYQNFIQVDMVGLPDQLMNERTDVDPTLPIVDKAAQAQEKAEAEAAAKDEADAMHMAEEKAKEEKAKAAKKEADEKTAVAEKKAKADKEKALKQMEREAAKEAALKGLKDTGSQKGRKAIAGNLKSQGTAMSGNVGTAKDRYAALVAMKIREHFNLYQWQKKKGLSTVVQIEITAQGRIKEKRLMKQSRDPVYDAAVMQAVEASQPLPVPDDMSLVSDGITLEFKPEN